MVCVLAVAGVVGVVAVLLILITLAMSDGDLVLIFKTKFGKQPESLAGKVVWITGASSGIGEYIAYCLAGAGCRLVLSARRKEELYRVKEKCLQKGNGKLSDDDVFVLPLDIIAYDTHKLAVQKVLETFSKIDILVNNAGRGQQSVWLEVDLNVDREMFEINCLGPVSLTQEVVPHMIPRGQGQVVVISSFAGKIGPPFFRSYSASKHALHGYFESLRAEMGQNNIDITLVCPGPVVSNISFVSLTGKPGEVVNKKFKSDENRVMTDRCAYLVCVAAANKLYEAWVSKHPQLMVLYLGQYFPDLARWVVKRFGTKTVKKMREHL